MGGKCGSNEILELSDGDCFGDTTAPSGSKFLLRFRWVTMPSNTSLRSPSGLSSLVGSSTFT